MRQIAIFVDGTWTSPEQGEATNVLRPARGVAPTLRDAKLGMDIVQLWFAGVHADVGGGYVERGLGDIAADWMTREARAVGLQFEPHLTSAFKPDFKAPSTTDAGRITNRRGRRLYATSRCRYMSRESWGK